MINLVELLTLIETNFPKIDAAVLPSVHNPKNAGTVLIYSEDETGAEAELISFMKENHPKVQLTLCQEI